MKLLSGGQTGVDRAALDVAIERGVAYGGWCPKGGWAEDFLSRRGCWRNTRSLPKRRSPTRRNAPRGMCATPMPA